MLYVERDKDGKIVSLTRTKTAGAADLKSATNEEIMQFLNAHDDEDSVRLSLSHSDSGLIRTIEDLISLLIEKKIIHFTELPVEAQKRITKRRHLRKKLPSTDLMVDDIL